MVIIFSNIFTSHLPRESTPLDWFSHWFFRKWDYSDRQLFACGRN